MKLEGMDEVLKNLDAAARKYPEATAKALFEEGLRIQKASVERTPVKYGRLRGSAYTSPPKMTSSGPEVEVGYGAEYGIYVHERTEIIHRVGQSKFLESALAEAYSGYANRIAAAIEKYANG